MTSLESILARYKTSIKLGDDENPSPVPDMQALAGELRSLRQKNEVYFIVLVVMLAMVFIAALILTFLFAGRPDNLASILGASGVTVGFAVRTMIGLWKQKVLMDVLIALIPQLNLGAQEQVINLVSLYLREGAASQEEVVKGALSGQGAAG